MKRSKERPSGAISGLVGLSTFREAMSSLQACSLHEIVFAPQRGIPLLLNSSFERRMQRSRGRFWQSLRGSYLLSLLLWQASSFSMFSFGCLSLLFARRALPVSNWASPTHHVPTSTPRLAAGFEVTERRKRNR